MAAEDFEKTQGGLNAQLKATGENIATVQPKIDALKGSMERLGFDSTAIERSFTSFPPSRALCAFL